MNWIEITVYTTNEALEIVSARFDMLGVSQVVLNESKAQVEAFLNESVKYWDFADLDSIVASEPCVKAYVADVADNAPLLKEIQAFFAELKQIALGIDMGSLRVEFSKVKDEDWENNWKAYYKPVCIGERLLVKPSWEDVENEENRVVLALDPGMAFGTGTHHTTQLCLEYAQELVKTGDDVLDLGCGSGILSIAALLLGAKHALAVDVDPITESIARENAELNGIFPDKYSISIGNVLEDAHLQAEIREQQYDIIFANIIASVIIGLAPMIPSLLKENGRFIASGIIAERADEVRVALHSAGLTVIDERQSEDWVAMLVSQKAVK